MGEASEVQHQLERGILPKVLPSSLLSSPFPVRFASCTPQVLPHCRVCMCVACESTNTTNPLENNCLHVS